jgi:hypothetical protein
VSHPFVGDPGIFFRLQNIMKSVARNCRLSGAGEHLKIVLLPLGSLINYILLQRLGVWRLFVRADGLQHLAGIGG